MNEGTSQARKLPIPAAVGIILGLWLIYTLLFTFSPGEPLMSTLGFIPGILGILALRAAGLTTEEYNLRMAAASRAGLGALAAVTLLLLPILLTGRWVGADWITILVYPLASGVSQELFFRAALLPVLTKALDTRGSWLALVLHALLFVAWHAPTFLKGAGWPVAIVLFLAGLGWGWQAQRDRTVAWTMAQHTLFLMCMASFTWG